MIYSQFINKSGHINGFNGKLLLRKQFVVVGVVIAWTIVCSTLTFLPPLPPSHNGWNKHANIAYFIGATTIFQIIICKRINFRISLCLFAGRYLSLSAHNHIVSAHIKINYGGIVRPIERSIRRNFILINRTDGPRRKWINLTHTHTIW